MKITASLLKVIKTVINETNMEEAAAHKKMERAIQQRIVHQPPVMAALARYKAVDKQIDELVRKRNKIGLTLDKLGVTCNGELSYDEANKVRAKLPPRSHISESAVIAELARADDKQGQAALKRLGIKWP